MSEKSFEALQQEIVKKLSDCFNTNRNELLKIEPVVQEWQQKIQKLNQYRDQTHLRNFLAEQLGLSNNTESQVHETTREEILASFESLFKTYLDFVPYENFTKASEILEQIRREPLDSHESVTTFIKLRTQLSNYLNDPRNEKCQRVHEKLTQAFKTVQAKLRDPASQGHAAIDETELISREVTEALKIYSDLSAHSSGDLGAVAVRRYDLSLTKEDMVALKDNKDIRSTLVDFFGLYLNERGENRVLFLKHDFAQTLLEGKEVAIENWETERVFWLKEYSAGAIGDIDGSVWKDYSRACVPFLNQDREWGLLCIDHEHKTARLVEFGTPLEENRANDLVRKIEKYLSGEKSGNEQTVYNIVRDNHRREGDNGRHVLYTMYQFQARPGSHEHDESEEKLADFSKKLFGTLVLIGINNDGYLKFDELLL